MRPLPLVGSYVFSPVLEAAARMPVEMLQGVRVSVTTELGVLCVVAVRCDVPRWECGVGQVADGQEVVLGGADRALDAAVGRVGIVQLSHCLLCALSDGGQQGGPLRGQSGPRPHLYL